MSIALKDLCFLYPVKMQTLLSSQLCAQLLIKSHLPPPLPLTSISIVS